MSELKHYRLRAETGFLGAGMKSADGLLGAILKTLETSGAAKIPLEEFAACGLDIRGNDFQEWLERMGCKVHVIVSKTN